MVFMGDRRTKEGKDAVAGGLGDESLIAMHSAHHGLQGWVHDGAGFFGVEVFNHRHGVLDVAKDGGDGFALAIRNASGL
jgi:hypothetical protein